MELLAVELRPTAWLRVDFEPASFEITTEQAEADIPVRWRDNGKFRAITLTLRFQSSEQVYAVYAAMDRDPRVRFKL